MTVPFVARDPLPVWGWVCEDCNVKWGVEAGAECWSCGRTAQVNAVLPFPSAAASIEDLLWERAG